MNFEGFIGSAYTSRSRNFDSERCINLFVEGADTGAGKSKGMLLGTPGLTLYVTLPGGGVRGLYTASNGRCFAVSGSTLCEVLTGGAYTTRGTLGSDAGPVSMVDNGTQLIVVDGTSAGYILTLGTNVFAAIVSAAFYGADRVSFFDGYFALNRPDTQQLYVSALLDGATYDGLEFVSDESSPDDIISLGVSRREMLVLGTRSGQLWFNAGAIDFPFQPIAGSAFPYGCAATHSLQHIGTFHWLGIDEHGALMVLKLSGYQPVRCSTHALEYAMNGYSRVDDAIGYVYQEEGHAFYALSFPTGGDTWVYDSATELWHERADIDPGSGLFTVHRVQHHAYALSRHLVGGETDGKVYTQSLDVFQNDADALVRERVTTFIHADRRLLYHSVFEVDMEAGVGLDGASGPGTTPDVMMQFSDDGGHTWSSERWVSAGVQGDYGARAIWRRLGRSRQRAYRVRISDPVKVAMLAARIEVS